MISTKGSDEWMVGIFGQILDFSFSFPLSFPSIFFSPPLFSLSPCFFSEFPRILQQIGAFIDFMTNGMVTRAHAVYEQLMLITEQLSRHDSVLLKVDSLCATIQTQAESLKLFRSSLAT